MKQSPKIEIRAPHEVFYIHSMRFNTFRAFVIRLSMRFAETPSVAAIALPGLLCM